jgi:hypothetical protein
MTFVNNLLFGKTLPTANTTQWMILDGFTQGCHPDGIFSIPKSLFG